MFPKCSKGDWRRTFASAVPLFRIRHVRKLREKRNAKPDQNRFADLLRRLRRLRRVRLHRDSAAGRADGSSYRFAGRNSCLYQVNVPKMSKKILKDFKSNWFAGRNSSLYQVSVEKMIIKSKVFDFKCLKDFKSNWFAGRNGCLYQVNVEKI